MILKIPGGFAYMFKINKTLSRPNVPRTIRFTEELFEELSRVSADEKISFNALVLQCCQYALCHYNIDDGLIKDESNG